MCGPTSPRRGFLGFFFPAVFPLIVVVLLANSLFHGVLFAEPLFQSLPIYVVMPAGPVVRAGLDSPTAPSTRPDSGRPDRGSGGRLGSDLGPEDASPVAQGSFTGSSGPGPRPGTHPGLRRRFRLPGSCWPVFQPGGCPAAAGATGCASTRRDLVCRWPGRGCGDANTGEAMTVIGQLADRLHATLVTHAYGVWAFRWRPPPGIHSVTMPEGVTPAPRLGQPGSSGPRCADRLSGHLARDVHREPGLCG